MSAIDTVSPSAGSVTLRSFLRRPVAAAALCVLAIIVIACCGAAVFAPYGPLEQDLLAALEGPSAAHWLGTDTLGRDVLSRLLWGGQPALLSALVATVTFGALGIGLGLIAGYSRGTADRIISAVIDVMMSLPGIVIMFVVLALFKNNLYAAMITLGFFAAGGLARVVRAATKATREELYVSAARVSGLSTARILFRHVLPRLTGPIVVQLSLFIGIALVVQSGLGFLNLGVQAPLPTWGGMVGEAAQVITDDPWLLVPSGGIIALTVLAFGLIGDAVRDVSAETKSRSGGVVVRRGTRAPRRIAAGESLLTVRGLTISFARRHGESTEVVHGVDFEVAPGELLGLVGESGSGKTVSALSLLGLLPANAVVEADEMRFGDLDFAGVASSGFRGLRGTRIGLVSQEPMVALDPSFRVGAQLREVVRAQRRCSRREADSRVRDLLAAVRLPDPAAVARRYPHELSGGMAQRVVIALALAGEPELLIADEPTTALDVTVQSEILDLLRALRDRHGMAIVLVTHDLGVVADFCERVIVMQHGRIVERQDSVGLFTAPEHPYTRELIDATPSLIDLPRAAGRTQP